MSKFTINQRVQNGPHGKLLLLSFLIASVVSVILILAIFAFVEWFL